MGCQLGDIGSDHSNGEVDDIFGNWDSDSDEESRQGHSSKSQNKFDLNSATLNLSSEGGEMFELAAQGALDNLIKVLSEQSNSVNTQNSDGHTLLMIACDRGDLTMVKFLVSQDADLDKQDNFGNTALMCACARGHASTVRYLMENGSKITMRQREGKTALMIASQLGHRETCKLFTRKSNIYLRNKSVGTPVKSKPSSFDPSRAMNIDMRDFDGRTSLILSIAQSHTIVAKILLSSGANAEIKDNRGWNALIWAIVKRQKSVASICLQSTRDIELGDNEGTTPMMYACRYGMKAIYEELLANGSDIGVQNSRGDTCLHEVCKSRVTDKTMFIRDDLIKKGASLEVYNKEGKSPLDLLPCITEEEQIESKNEKNRLIKLAKHVTFFWMVYYQFFVPSNMGRRVRERGGSVVPNCGEVNCG